MRFPTLCAMGALFAVASLAQPSITQIQNNYSYTLPGLPNYGIAQGSIVAIFGKNLAPSNTGLQSPTLPSTLNGVTGTVTVNGVTKNLIFYYVTTGQLGAIIPSSTPVGTGTLSITANGQTTTSPIKVTAGGFGILTLNGAGTGTAAAFDANNGNALLNFTAAANPGDTLVLWGTGLGPVTGDETQYQTQANMSTPIEVDIGGISANVSYHGRSQFSGLDQINVVVPQNVTAGCYVSVDVIVNNTVSNFATIPVAPSGSRVCSDQTTGLTAAQQQSIGGLSSFSYGAITIGKSTSAGITIPGAGTFGGGTTDSATATFAKVSVSEFNASGLSGFTASMGSCTVFTFSGQNTSVPQVQFTPLNAGPSITVTGPNGTKTMPYSNGVYSATLGGGTGASALPIFIPATGGNFTFDNGSGGPDIGHFSGQITLGAPLVWTNMNSITNVTRSSGQDITWTGGAANSYVDITGFSVSSADANAVGAGFICTAPVAAGSFHIPAAVLLALPPSASVSGISTGSLAVSNYTNPQSITVPNVQFATISGYTTNSTFVNYQ